MGQWVTGGPRHDSRDPSRFVDPFDPRPMIHLPIVICASTCPCIISCNTKYVFRQNITSIHSGVSKLVESWVFVKMQFVSVRLLLGLGDCDISCLCLIGSLELGLAALSPWSWDVCHW